MLCDSVDHYKIQTALECGYVGGVEEAVCCLGESWDSVHPFLLKTVCDCFGPRLCRGSHVPHTDALVADGTTCPIVLLQRLYHL